MAPPPETPTPRRFVLPKKHSGTGLPPRQSQQQHHETPKSSLPLPPIVHTTHSSSQMSHPQFRATPKFSLHSTPRPPRASQQAAQYQPPQPGPPSTPAAPPGSAYFRSSRVKNVLQSGTGDEDAIDSSPPGGDFEDEQDHGRSETEHGEAQENLRAHPAVMGVHFRRRSQDDEIDWIVTESSPPAGDDDAEEASAVKHHREEVDLSSALSDAGYDEYEEGIIKAPSPKRRRLSISSLPPFSSERNEGMRLSSLPPDFVEFVDQNYDEDDGHREDAESPQGFYSKAEEEGEMELPNESTDNDPSTLSANLKAPVEDNHNRTPEEELQQHHNQLHRQQPAFHKAPRFKQQQNPQHPDSDRHYDPLPEAFSPSRRQNKNASKYVPGGLASELRDWLVDMEAATGLKRENDWLARIVVDEMPESAGSAIKSTGMQLIYGHHRSAQPGDGDEDIHPERDDAHMTNDHGNVQSRAAGTIVPDADRVMIILAGAGRVTPGIAKRKQVSRGVVVGIARPTWEITLGDLGRWAVACDWAILG